jgi:hypothetical protein
MYLSLMTVLPMVLRELFAGYKKNFLMNFSLKSEQANSVWAPLIFMVLNGQ